MNNVITKEDFLKMVKSQGLEVLRDISPLSKAVNFSIEKSLTNELSSEEVVSTNIALQELQSFTQWSVLNDDFSKAILYTRPEQVEWTDCDRGEYGEILKSRAGIYKNTPENRKLGRVGQKYGEVTSITQGSKERVEKKGDGVHSSLGGVIEESLKILEDRKTSSNLKKEQEVERINNNNKKYVTYIDKVKEVIPSLVDVLNKEGFKIESLSPKKTGIGEDWEDDDYMNVSLSLIPISEKVKFIEFSGNTASGESRNKKQRDSRALKLSDAIKSATGLTSVMVNPYSFEVKNKSEKKRVLVDFWIK